ncbi:hypothetical protein TNCV_5070361 [Trichonephila clavipes]|nr:hypothetical protein TNCV_5070361 [Trichonephila clavipes]
MLTADHKRQRVKRPKNFSLSRNNRREGFLDSIVTGDGREMGYTSTTPETKEHRAKWKHPLRRQEQRSSNKSCLPGKSWLAFFGIESGRIVVRVYALAGQTINFFRPVL